MDFKKIFSLRERRKQLETRIAESRQKVISAERALTLLQRLEDGIDGKIKCIRECVTSDGLPYVRPDTWARPEDRFSGRRDYQRERATVEALQRLKKDLPGIRKHWEEQLNQALANN